LSKDIASSESISESACLSSHKLVVTLKEKILLFLDIVGRKQIWIENAMI
jgi:hypothetical protein